MRILFIIVIISITQSDAVHACQCFSRSYQYTYDSSDVVFTGIVTGKEDPRVGEGLSRDTDLIAYKFIVTRLWKGDVNDTIFVNSFRSETWCGYNFVKDGHYLVFSRRKGGKLQTGLCSRNSTLENATVALHLLPAPIYSRAGYQLDLPPLDTYTDSLLVKVQTGNRNIKSRAASELMDIQAYYEKTMPVIINLLDAEDEEDWRNAFKVLGSYGYTARVAVHKLVPFLCHEKRIIRANAGLALMNIYPEIRKKVEESKFYSSHLAVIEDCEEYIQQIQEIEIEPLPPDNLYMKGGNLGRGYFVGRRRN